MTTQCTPTQLPFHPFGRREVVARFDAGRRSGRVEHGVEELVAQRVHGLALGYEDLNDHDRLRSDPLLALAAGKADPTGLERARARDRGHALAGSSTLNRLELGAPGADERRWRYSKIVADGEALDRLLVKLFLESHGRAPETVWLDLDATDDPLHGAPRGAVLPRLLQELLLPAAVYLQRRTPAVRTAAPVEHRRGPRAAFRSWSGSSGGSGNASRRCGSWCGATRAFAATRSWTGANATRWTMSWGWRATNAWSSASARPCASPGPVTWPRAGHRGGFGPSVTARAIPGAERAAWWPRRNG